MRYIPFGRWLVLAVMLFGPLGAKVFGESGRNLHYLVVDASGSIKQNRMIKPIVDAVKRHVNRLGEEDEVRVAIFNKDVTFQSTWPSMTFDAKTDFGKKFAKKYVPSNETYLYDTVDSVLDEVGRDAGEYETVKILILSDGNDSKNGTIKTWDPIVERACNLVRTHPSSLITFYPIGFKDAILPEDCIEVTYINEQAVEIPPDPPRADFEAAPLTAKTGEEITFFARRSPGAIDTLTWSFGDGAEASGPLETHEVVRHAYSEPGPKTVSLTAVGIGGKDQEVREAYVAIEDIVRPVAAFSWTPKAPRVGEDLILVNESTGSPDSLVWFVEGYAPRTGAAPRVTMQQAGTVSVALEARRGDLKDRKVDALTVLPPLPQAAIAISPEDGVDVGGSVRLAAAPAEEGVVYRWRVAGENIGEGLAIDWTATEPGTVDVELSAEGPGGTATARERLFVRELPPPDAAFSAEPTGEVDVGAEIRLSASARADGVRHRWRIGEDALALEGPDAVWTARAPGSVTIVHEAEGPGGVSTARDRLLVRDIPVPKADFTIEPRDVEVGAEVVMRAVDTNPDLEHVWRIDGKTYRGSEVHVTAKEAKTVAVLHEVTSHGKTGQMERAFTAVDSVLLTPEFSASPRKGT
ncbi:MAG: VWA domain-containing protein, partial [Kiritimatiellae bacterium]|nr:VWA domain-containing protein [Kiritimatiellia bacterium]